MLLFVDTLCCSYKFIFCNSVDVLRFLQIYFLQFCCCTLFLANLSYRILLLQSGTCNIFVNMFQDSTLDIYALFFSASYASRTACESWSTQEVPRIPHWMPFKRSSICVTVRPSTSEATPCVLPLHPPVNATFVMTSPLISKSIWLEQVPLVL